VSRGIFCDRFDPDEVSRDTGGSLELGIGCDGGSASYTSSEDGFGCGIFNLSRLSTLDGLAGQDCLPSAKTPRFNPEKG